MTERQQQYLTDLTTEATRQAAALQPKAGWPVTADVISGWDRTRLLVAALIERSATASDPSAVIEAWTTIRRNNGSEQGIAYTLKQVAKALGLGQAEWSALLVEVSK